MGSWVFQVWKFNLHLSAGRHPMASSKRARFMLCIQDYSNFPTILLVLLTAWLHAMARICACSVNCFQLAGCCWHAWWLLILIWGNRTAWRRKRFEAPLLARVPEEKKCKHVRFWCCTVLSSSLPTKCLALISWLWHSVVYGAVACKWASRM